MRRLLFAFAILAILLTACQISYVETIPESDDNYPAREYQQKPNYEPFQLPAMTAEQQHYFDEYVSRLLWNGMLALDWSGEDFRHISTAPYGLGDSLNLMMAFEDIVGIERMGEIWQEHDIRIPADIVEETLLRFFPFTVEQIREILYAIYDDVDNTYTYAGGRGGGYIFGVVTNVERWDGYVVLSYSLYVGESKSLQNSGALTLKQTDDGFVFWSAEVFNSNAVPPMQRRDVALRTPTLEQSLNRAILFYPDGVSFQFVRQDQITIATNQDRERFMQQDFYLYDVFYNEKKVSGVAIGSQDGSLWIYNMTSGDGWFSERFMGLRQPSQPDDFPPSEPIVEIMAGGGALYFVRIDTIPELSNRNEGTASWNEEDQTLSFSAVKAIGTVTGASDGPFVRATVTWASGEAELLHVEFLPAPIFSHPSQVLRSGEEIYIEADRLIQIAEYFRALILELS